MRDDIDLSDLTEDEAPSPAPQTSALRLGVGIHEWVPIADYIADPCEEASLRSGDLRRMLRLTPRKFQAHHPRLSEKPAWAVKKATKRMDAGAIIHELVLGFGAGFAVIDPANYKTKDGKPAQTLGAAECKAAVAEAKSRGLAVINPKDNEAAQRVKDRISVNFAEEFGEWPTGLREATIVWQEETAHGPVLCRTRPDLIVPDRALVGDIKTTAHDLSDDGVQRLLSANDGATVIQAAWQIRGLSAAMPDLRGRIDHVVYFADLEYPNEVAPVSLSKIALVMADRRCMRGVERYAMLRERGEFDSWAPRIGSLTSWLDSQWTAEEENHVGAAEA